MAINISDVYANHTITVICLSLIDYMKSIGAKYHGVIGYEMGKRINPNNKDSQKKGFGEPILVFGVQDSKPISYLVELLRKIQD